jgi:hypothetical protein
MLARNWLSTHHGRPPAAGLELAGPLLGWAVLPVLAGPAGVAVPADGDPLLGAELAVPDAVSDAAPELVAEPIAAGVLAAALVVLVPAPVSRPVCVHATSGVSSIIVNSINRFLRMTTSVSGGGYYLEDTTHR